MHTPRKRVLFATVAAAAIGLPLTAVPAFAADALTIAEIQGASHVSPYNGQAVADVPGIVTAVSRNGFWMQSATPDNDPATSEGILVYTKAPTVAIGDSVTVSAKVKEYRPGSIDGANLAVTELIEPVVTVVGTGELPEPTVIGPGGRVAPDAIHTANPGDIEIDGVFDVDANAIDFYESMEGMLVRVSDAVAVSPTNSYGELVVLPGGDGANRTDRGGVKATEADTNTERVMLKNLLAPLPKANVGDSLPGDIDGVLDYDFGNFKVNVLATPSLVDNGLEREVTRAHESDELAVATYNVENLDAGDSATVFARHGESIAVNLASPDILAIEEIQDDTGSTDDGVVSATATLDLLVEAIVAAGGPTYEYRQIDPANNMDGGQPGGNIRVGFLFNPERVDFTDVAGGDATTPVEVRSEKVKKDCQPWWWVGCWLFGGNKKTVPALSVSPGRIAPTDAAWDESRKPLVGEFVFEGEKVFVVANHFASKGGDDPLYGRFQSPTRISEEQRHAQAIVVNDFVKRIQDVDRRANVVVLGDINDFEYSQTVAELTADEALAVGYDLLDESERYSYVFEGNSQVLDQILVSPNLMDDSELDVVHVNAEFANQASDHDPSVIRIRL